MLILLFLSLLHKCLASNLSIPNSFLLSPLIFVSLSLGLAPFFFYLSVSHYIPYLFHSRLFLSPKSLGLTAVDYHTSKDSASSVLLVQLVVGLSISQSTGCFHRLIKWFVDKRGLMIPFQVFNGIAVICYQR